MLADASTFSGFAFDDFDAALRFYGETLGLPVSVLDEENGMLELGLGDDRKVLAYLKADHAPANYTILNFQVDDVEATVDGLTACGVSFERYDGFDQDEKGIARGNGPEIAWFKDPPATSSR